MTVFADASSLVKLYVDEPGAEEVRAREHLVVAQVSRVEVAAALWGKVRTGSGTAELVAPLVAEFTADWWGDPGPGRFAVLGTSAGLLEDAVRLSGKHLLRGYDAVQLASAVAAASVDPTTTLLAHDHRLLAAARVEGLVLDPGCPPAT